MHVIKDKNMTFSKNKKNDFRKYEIQKLISIFYKCVKRKNMDNDSIIKNKKVVKRIKNKNIDELGSIKEEEEKSKMDNSIKEIENNKNKINKKIENEDVKKEKERPVSAFSGGVRNRYLNRLHKK